MDIISPKEQNSIIKLFKEQGILLPEGENPLAFLVTTDNKEFIRLYIDGHKLVIFPEDDKYYQIKGKILEYKNKYKNMKDKSILEQISPQAKEELEKIWFTADHHHGHNKIVDFFVDIIARESLDTCPGIGAQLFSQFFFFNQKI